jgi:hypothetical protein
MKNLLEQMVIYIYIYSKICYQVTVIVVIVVVVAAGRVFKSCSANRIPFDK